MRTKNGDPNASNTDPVVVSVVADVVVPEAVIRLHSPYCHTKTKKLIEIMQNCFILIKNHNSVICKWHAI